MKIWESGITLILFLSLFACTEKKNPPTYSKYLEYTELMLNISKKFAFEPNATKLNKVAVATQQARIISCTDFNGECDRYGKFISSAIEFSQDGILAPDERIQLELELSQLTATIKDGRAKLQNLKTNND